MTDFSLRIATLILPLRDNAGNKVTDAHAHLRASILDDFGGYTQTLVTGCWEDEAGIVHQDDSLKYEIAMDTGPGHGQKLVRIAAVACGQARQKCVMIVLASGVVHFVNECGDLVT